MVHVSMVANRHTRRIITVFVLACDKDREVTFLSLGKLKLLGSVQFQEFVVPAKQLTER